MLGRVREEPSLLYKLVRNAIYIFGRVICKIMVHCKMCMQRDMLKHWTFFFFFTSNVYNNENGED